ncbi:MAG: tRNA (adenosine(37)-N6)-dimethylallyltransferase MiaA, partial [Pseudomonadota bacterium]|nr:tRNA (adenosine(37)-N6)-dimethylallyltransferase MiaA [Pseudomonadota bacterium]
ALAERLDGVVINADALQVYDGWRVLTARPTAEDEARAPRRLYGHVPPTEPYSTGRWLGEAAAEIAAARAAGRVPILVGGTGLYFTALTEGLADIPPTPPEIRAAAEAELARLGLPAFAEALRARDPETHARLDLANPRRVLRAWEALETTGRPLARLQAETPAPLLPLSAARAVRLMPDRAALYAGIDTRFDVMLEGGALDEARAAMSWTAPAPTAMQALGAAELIAHLRGEISLAEARDAAARATRRYAKRQLSWARNRLAVWPAAASPAEALARLAPCA